MAVSATGEVTAGRPGRGRRLILWRHGQTSWNVERRFQGTTDVELTETGLGQARRAARLLASAPNDRQVKSIVDEIEEHIQKELGVKPVRREGDREARWVLLDYVDIVVHVQHSEERVFYALERLWKDCPELDLPEDAKATRGKAAEHAKLQEAEEATGPGGEWR